MRNHTLKAIFVVLAGLGSALHCGPKDGSETGDSSTGEPAVEWPIGFFYRPGGRTPATGALIMLDVKPDFTVDMYVHYCTVDPRYLQTMGWRWTDDETIEFYSLDPEQPLFYAVGEDQVSMKRVDDTTVRVVVDVFGPEGEGITFGEFRRLLDETSKWPCFVLLKPPGFKKEECLSDSVIEFGCEEPFRPDEPL